MDRPSMGIPLFFSQVSGRDSLRRSLGHRWVIEGDIWVCQDRWPPKSNGLPFKTAIKLAIKLAIKWSESQISEPISPYFTHGAMEKRLNCRDVDHRNTSREERLGTVDEAPRVKGPARLTRGAGLKHLLSSPVGYLGIYTYIYSTYIWWINIHLDVLYMNIYVYIFISLYMRYDCMMNYLTQLYYRVYRRTLRMAQDFCCSTHVESVMRLWGQELPVLWSDTIRNSLCDGRSLDHFKAHNIQTYTQRQHTHTLCWHLCKELLYR